MQTSSIRPVYHLSGVRTGASESRLRDIFLTFVASLTAATSINACTDRDAVVPVAVSAPVAAAPATDKWLGQWIGPEGTFLRLAGSRGTYDVTIQNLDGPRVFKGQRVGDEIHFERDGKSGSIHATNGLGTGMKWLAEKQNCLTVSVGEGYCRD